VVGVQFSVLILIAAFLKSYKVETTLQVASLLNTEH
jgi:hypothetical protein